MFCRVPKRMCSPLCDVVIGVPHLQHPAKAEPARGSIIHGCSKELIALEYGVWSSCAALCMANVWIDQSQSTALAV